MSLLLGDHGGSGPGFSLAGIPIRVEWTFVVWTVLIGASFGDARLAVAWFVLLFVSILVHELGHAAAMRVYGFSPSIEIHAMGGLTAWSREKTPSPKQRLIVTACGPAAGLALGGLVYALKLGFSPISDPLLNHAITQALWVNLGWSFVNLLPVLPWDGGLILDAGVELVSKKPRPKIAAISSIVVGALTVLAGLYSRQYFMLIYIGGVGVWQGYSRLAPKKPEDDELNQIWVLMQAQRFSEAERMAVDKALRTADIDERAKLYEAVAWSRLLRDDWRGADMAIEKMSGIKPSRHLAATIAAHSDLHEEVIAMLTPLPTLLAPEILLRTDALIATKRYEQVVRDALDLLARSEPSQKKIARALSARLFEAGAYEPSMQVSLSAFDALRTADDLYNAACAQAKLGELDRGLATLNRAIDAGYTDRKALTDDQDLAPLRSAPGWDALLARVP